MGFLGLILVYQTGYQTEQMIGDLQMIGALFLQLAFRELAPVITGAMLATRVGTGIAAEIGSMVVTEQVDALRMNNAEPVSYLVVPRTIACIVMTFMLSCIGLIVAFLMGMVGAYMIFDVNPYTYYNTRLLEWGDLIIFLLKSFSFGAVIPVISAHAGLTTYGGSQGVGMATTNAVVNTTLAIVIIDFFLTAFGYVAFFS
jgi:phospholipid/cholesterol/gamma-HCH transport system permease protein